MRTTKSVFGLFSALVLYCFGLVYCFIDVSGSAREAQKDGLGPTLLGLGVIGLLFCIPLIVKLVGFLARPRPPGSSGGGDLVASAQASESNADAIVARYIASQSADAAPRPPAHKASGPAKPSGFGRKLA